MKTGRICVRRRVSHGLLLAAANATFFCLTARVSCAFFVKQIVGSIILAIPTSQRVRRAVLRVQGSSIHDSVVIGRNVRLKGARVELDAGVYVGSNVEFVGISDIRVPSGTCVPANSAITTASAVYSSDGSLHVEFHEPINLGPNLVADVAK